MVQLCFSSLRNDGYSHDLQQCRPKLSLRHSPSLSPVAVAMISDSVRDEINLLLSRHQVSAVLGWEKISKVLAENNLSLHARIPPEEMGVSLANRSGMIADVGKAHNVGHDICMQAFTLSKASHATAFMMPKASGERKKITYAKLHRFAIRLVLRLYD